MAPSLTRSFFKTRECWVPHTPLRPLAQLLLRGHSTVSVALQLGISPTTVKTHRKNLYAKLGIATQFELFSRFLDTLKYRPRN